MRLLLNVFNTEKVHYVLFFFIAVNCFFLAKICFFLFWVTFLILFEIFSLIVFWTFLRKSRGTELVHPREIFLYVSFRNGFIAFGESLHKVLVSHGQVQLFLGKLFDLFRLETRDLSSHRHHRCVSENEHWTIKTNN